MYFFDFLTGSQNQFVFFFRDYNVVDRNRRARYGGVFKTEFFQTIQKFHGFGISDSPEAVQNKLFGLAARSNVVEIRHLFGQDLIENNPADRRFHQVAVNHDLNPGMESELFGGMSGQSLIL